MSDDKQTTAQIDANDENVKQNTGAELAEEKHELLKKSGGRRRSSKPSYTDPSQPKRRGVCPNYFGVKSYLHEFYDPNATYKDPQIYEDDDDYRYLLNPNSKRRRRCPPVWLKVCIWVGVNLLLFGMIGIIVGYFVPQKAVIKKQEGSVAFIDHSAVHYNTVLDLCKLVGLIFFCVGGILLASALLFPSFLSSYCEDDHSDEAIKVSLGDNEKQPLSPIEMTVPATSKLKNVQPTGKGETSRLPQQDDTVHVKD